MAEQEISLTELKLLANKKNRLRTAAQSTLSEYLRLDDRLKVSVKILADSEAKTIRLDTAALLSAPVM